MKKFIVALDLDQTLLNNDRKVTKYTKSVLKAIKQKGFLIAISTTQGYGSCKKIAKQIHADYACCHSGNMIVDKNGAILYKNPFSKAETKEFLDTFLPYTENIVFDTKDKLVGKESDIGKAWGVKPCVAKNLIKYEPYKICIFNEPKIQKLLENFCKTKEFVLRPMRGTDVCFITQKDSDKFKALEKLIEMEETDLNHLIVFGDDLSDLESIKQAKYGVAVQNAREKVLSMANYITDSNQDDGVAKFLEERFLNEKN